MTSKRFPCMHAHHSKDVPRAKSPNTSMEGRRRRILPPRGGYYPQQRLLLDGWFTSFPSRKLFPVLIRSILNTFVFYCRFALVVFVFVSIFFSIPPPSLPLSSPSFFAFLCSVDHICVKMHTVLPSSFARDSMVISTESLLLIFSSRPASFYADGVFLKCGGNSCRR